jgi:hypothetical protein
LFSPPPELGILGQHNETPSPTLASSTRPSRAPPAVG